MFGRSSKSNHHWTSISAPGLGPRLGRPKVFSTIFRLSMFPVGPKGWTQGWGGFGNCHLGWLRRYCKDGFLIHRKITSANDHFPVCKKSRSRVCYGSCIIRCPATWHGHKLFSWKMWELMCSLEDVDDNPRQSLVGYRLHSLKLTLASQKWWLEDWLHPPFWQGGYVSFRQGSSINPHERLGGHNIRNGWSLEITATSR